MAKATRFIKGQTVYQAHNYFASNQDTREMMLANQGKPMEIEMRVISRIVDACGTKQVTFLDRGHDSVFGRKAPADSDTLFATPEEAFEYLRGIKARCDRETRVHHIHPEVVGDDVWVKSMFQIEEKKNAQ